MSRPHQEVLLLTGLGDDTVVERQVSFVNFLNKRRPSAAQILAFPTRWQTPESYTAKRTRLSEFIATHSGIQVVYGISVGASMGLTTIHELGQGASYHFVAGKMSGADSISHKRRTRAPALEEAVRASEAVIEQVDLSVYDITCHYCFFDGIVPKQEMLLPKTIHHRIPMINHSAAIAFAYPTVLRQL